MKNLRVIIPIFIFTLISLISIYSAQNMLSSDYNDLYIKQIIWYLVGYLVIIILARKKSKISDSAINILYILGNFLLLLVLFFGTEANGSRCWFTIPKIGSFQPSEFMKIFLILMLSKEINKYNTKNYIRNFKNEFFIILKCIILTLIPTILTFLEPDTGIVLIYFIILFVILFTFGIRYRWFIFGLILISSFVLSFLYLFFYNKEVFIKLLGTDFFYRMDRILDWSNGSGMQLTNALASFGSAGFFGYGINNNPIYFPEPHTDFIFSVFITNFGFIGAITLITIIIYFDAVLLKIGLESKKEDKYIIAGFISIILFQQIQNISMNIGILPITGITLPFISYGGSSLLSYMIIIGIILNINKKNNYKMNY